MSVLTNIGLCKQKMSKDGWALFCTHRQSDPLSPFNPEELADDEDILLTNLEVHQYEYS